MTRRKSFLSFLAGGALAPLAAQTQVPSATGLALYSGWRAFPTNPTFPSHGAVVSTDANGKHTLHIAVQGGASGMLARLPFTIPQAAGAVLANGSQATPVLVTPDGIVILTGNPESSWILGTISL